MEAGFSFETEQFILRHFGSVPKRAGGYARVSGKSRRLRAPKFQRLYARFGEFIR
jgi:hypothetical protein